MGYTDDFYSKLNQGLNLLGWQLSSRFTSEDNVQLASITEKAIELNNTNLLSLDTREALSLEAYKILSFQVIGIDERSDAISTRYIHCQHLSPLIPLIDEASFAFYRGYFTAALALLLIVLERYLRSIYTTDTGNTNPRFYDLKEHILSFPNRESANIAYGIVNILYSRYNVESPSSYEFNRHGLLHGIRGQSKYDEMNCARIYQLFDIFCSAREINRTGWGDCLDNARLRYGIYRRCLKTQAEQEFISS